MKRASNDSLTPLKKAENRIQARKNARIIPIQSISDHPNAEILRSVHVSRLIESRAFEIEKLTEALNKSEIMSKARAFQKVPRYLRRRAASHNPKKVPRKYRKQAEQELSFENSKLKKKFPLDLKKGLKKRRQAFKKLKRRILRLKTTHWIPTHVWHAKRFHMLPIWDLKIPDTPTQKCARAFYRASQHGSVCFDQSYMKMYACQSTQRDHLIDVFATWVPKLRGGYYSTRVCEGWFRDDLNQTLIAPVTFLWMEETLLWMVLHPLAESDVLELVGKKLKENPHLEIQLEEVTQVGLVSLYGPHALGLLQSVLKLDHTKESFISAATLWKQLEGVLDPATLPSGITLELQVWDPRLSYPPTRPNYTCSIQAQKQSQTVLEQPWPKLSYTLHKTIQQPLRKLAWSKLHARRSQLSIPGTPLSPDPKLDTSFPIFLWTSPPSSSSSSSLSSFLRGNHAGLHILLPRKFTLPFWRSIVYAGARPGGLTEYRAFHLPFHPVYPFDYPETRAYQLHHQPLAQQQLQRWQRTPSAKRINYSALGIHHPFLPNWKHLVHPNPTPQLLPLPNVVKVGAGWVRVQLLLESGIAKEHAVVFKDLNKTCHIGYVTTGKYVFQQGQCVAWAVVLQTNDASAYLSLGAKLYVQTPSRPVVYTAKIVKIYP